MNHELPVDEEERQRRDSLALEAGRAFSPTAPIDERSLFAGRDAQVRRVIDTINQKGQHAIIYGERGVGKTSLANVLATFLSLPSVLAPRVNCEGLDSFDSVWRKVFEQIELQKVARSAGYVSSTRTVGIPSLDALIGSAEITGDAVRRALTVVGESMLPIIIVDEFDRLNSTTKKAFADAIKTLSDHSVRATVVLVGVADSVDQLIEEHLSVERALVQVQMPRMSSDEIMAIIHKGLDRLQMSIEPVALKRIAVLSQGLPHYTHLIGLYASRHAIDAGSTVVKDVDVEEAIMVALDGAQQSIKSDWHRATMSPRRDNLFADVLLSCALATTDELGYFAAQDVRRPMCAVKGKRYEIPSFSQHLNEFCDAKRGPVLQKIGERRGYRFRFVNPLMQPFVIMKGLSSGQLTREMLDELQEPAKEKKKKPGE